VRERRTAKNDPSKSSPGSEYHEPVAKPWGGKEAELDCSRDHLIDWIACTVIRVVM
jgi:hypothetical protein